MNREAVLASIPVQASDFVVEIGAGSQPFRYTKLIVDKYPFENVERYGDVLNIAPIIQADAHKLPLADQSCDLLFTSHVLEHLEDPQKFLSEAARCSKFVYLEFPTLPRELMYAWSFHKWMIELENGCLVFYRNDVPQMFSDFFHKHYDFLFDTWSQQRFADLNTHLFSKSDELRMRIAAESAFEHIVRRSKQGGEKENYPSMYGQTGMGNVDYSVSVRLKIALWVLTPRWMIRARVRGQWSRNKSLRKPITEDILRRLLCQECRQGSMKKENADLVCVSCGRRYTARENVYNFDI